MCSPRHIYQMDDAYYVCRVIIDQQIIFYKRFVIVVARLFNLRSAEVLVDYVSIIWDKYKIIDRISSLRYLGK